MEKWTSFETILVLSVVKHSFILTKKVLMRNNLLISKHLFFSVFIQWATMFSESLRRAEKNFAKITTLKKIFFPLTQQKRHEILYTVKPLWFQTHLIFALGTWRKEWDAKKRRFSKYGRKNRYWFRERYRYVSSVYKVIKREYFFYRQVHRSGLNYYIFGDFWIDKKIDSHQSDLSVKKRLAK